MNEQAARNTLLLRAFETSADDDRWTDADRSWANRVASEVSQTSRTTDPIEFVARRAELGTQRLVDRDPSIDNARDALTWRSWVGPLIIAIAFALGLATDAIGPSKKINVLAPPLMGILLWNLIAYLLMLGMSVWSLIGQINPLAGPINRLVAWLANGLGKSDKPSGTRDGPVARFTQDWLAASGKLTGARVAGILHWGAAAFALGALLAMYMRGIGLEYLAGWESTFLDSQQVQQLFSWLFAPASWLSGLALPTLEQVEQMRFDRSDGVNAAPWIHFYAITLGVFVILPRTILALINTIRAARLRQHFNLETSSPYFESLARVHRGESARVQVLPYSYKVPGTSADALSRILGRIQGAAADIRFAAPLAQGEEDDWQLNQGEVPDAMTIALFSLTATPEDETHGQFARVLREQVPGASVLLAAVDESGFRQRFSGQPERLEQRRAAWRKVLGGASITPVFVDLSSSALIQAEQSMRDALAAHAPALATTTQ